MNDRPGKFSQMGKRAPLLAALLLGASATFAIAKTAQTDAPPASTTKIKVETVASGLENPWGLQFLPDGRMIVTERPGRIRIVAKDGELSAPVTGVPPVYASGQGGLLDIRLAPDFPTSGTIYLSYAEPRGDGQAATAAASAKLTLDVQSGGGTLSDLKVIFRQQPARSAGVHFGSRVVPAPDGTLFITTGDRGAGDNSQRTDGTIGKVIRIRPDGSAPDDNPRIAGWAPEIWSIGHRNIQGAAIDPASGQLWTVEHGARGGDELNRPEKGKNYGWPVISYGRNYSLTKIGEGTAKDGMEQPVYYWDPSIATSGLAFVTKDVFPGWKGSILVSGLAGARISRLTLADGKVTAEETLLADEGMRIRDVREGPDGSIYALVDERRGQIVRLSPAGG